jgi:hypothetical protein
VNRGRTTAHWEVKIALKRVPFQAVGLTWHAVLSRHEYSRAMNFFGWVSLADVVAILTIAALIYALVMSWPADQNRSEMAGIVRDMVSGAPWSKSGYARIPIGLRVIHRRARNSPPVRA